MDADGPERRIPAEEADARDVPETARGVFLASLSWRTAVGFIAAYTALLFAGYEPKLNPAAITMVWPADAVVFVTLALLRKRDWPLIVAIAVACDIIVNGLAPGPTAPFQFGRAAWFAATHVIDGVVGAALVQHWIKVPLLHHLRHVVRFYQASGVACACSATLGVAAYVALHPGPSPIAEWLHWWSSTFLGAVTDRADRVRLATALA